MDDHGQRQGIYNEAASYPQRQYALTARTRFESKSLIDFSQSGLPVTRAIKQNRSTLLGGAGLSSVVAAVRNWRYVIGELRTLVSSPGQRRRGYIGRSFGLNAVEGRDESVVIRVHRQYAGCHHAAIGGCISPLWKCGHVE